MPAQTDCPQCNGTGKRNGEVCDSCNGTGKIGVADTNPDKEPDAIPYKEPDTNPDKEPDAIPYKEPDTNPHKPYNENDIK